MSSQTIQDYAKTANPDRPLVICDVDEVALEFIAHFDELLDQHGYRLHRNSYRLDGNVLHKRTGEPQPIEDTKKLLKSLYHLVASTQRPVTGMQQALKKLQCSADLVFLTNFPAELATQRQSRLTELGIEAPLFTNEGSKGTAINILSSNRTAPVFFIDDSANHIKAALALPQTIQCIQFVADAGFASLAAKRPIAGTRFLTRDWAFVTRYIEAEMRAHR